MEDLIIRHIGRTILPFILVYGFYVLLHEHLSPGGSFAGGAILGSSLILFALAFNLVQGSKKLSYNASLVVIAIGALWFVVVGLRGIHLGENFLSNQIAGFKTGVPGELMSGGIIKIIPLGLGIKVASILVTLFYSLIEVEEGDVSD